jgi:hypothetical protein
MQSKYGSRKFLLAVGMAVVAIVNAILEANGLHTIPAGTMDQVFNIILVYLGVEGATDAINAFKGGTIPPKGGDH